VLTRTFGAWVKGARRVALMAACGGVLDSRVRGALPFIGGRRWLRRCAVNPTAWSQHGSGYGGARSGWAARVGAAGQWRAAAGARRFARPVGVRRVAMGH
jgi:hypothetical protein